MLFHSPLYNTPLHEFGITKPFALDRGHLVLEKLRDEFTDLPVTTPEPITLEDAALVHSKEYLQSLSISDTWRQIFELTDDDYAPQRATRTLDELIHDILLKSGGTVQATFHALQYGLAANLGGGYHHAFPDRGRGFCVLHDIAIAIRKAKREGLCEKVLVLDVDFHQGDGTAVVFAQDPDVFTFSIHSAEGWPETKQKSSLDIHMQSGEEASYLGKLQNGISSAMRAFTPDVVLFVAGSDAYEKDVLPGTRFLQLSLQQMRKRDEFVIDYFAERRIPLSMVFAGGYGPDVWEVHYFAVRRLLQQSRGLVEPQRL